MRWYRDIEEKQEKKAPVSEEIKDTAESAERNELQEAYERGFHAGFQAAKEMRESLEDVEEMDEITEGLIEDAIKGIRNVDFYEPFKNLAKKSLKLICKKANGKSVEDIVANIKETPVDSLNPIYNQILSTATSKEKNAISLMKKNGFNKPLMAIILNLCRESGANLSDYTRLNKNHAVRIMDHFQKTASKFWNEFFSDKKNMSMVQAAIA